MVKAVSDKPGVSTGWVHNRSWHMHAACWRWHMHGYSARSTLLDSTSTSHTGAFNPAGQHIDKPYWCLQVPLAEAPATLPGQVLQQIAEEFQAIQDPKQRMQVTVPALAGPQGGGTAFCF